MIKEFIKNMKNGKDFNELSIDELARLGAKKLLSQTLELEVEQAIESQSTTFWSISASTLSN